MSLPNPTIVPTIIGGVVPNAVADIAIDGDAVAADLPLRIDPTTLAGVITADGRNRLAYHGTVAPPLAIPENALLTVTDCASNPILVDGVAMRIVNVRQRATVPVTLFDLYRKVQP